jgi:hypothetical protein
MQHIGIQLQNLKGEIFKTSEVNFAEILKVLYDIQDSKVKYSWLMTIDPYGDTLFNQLQISQIINELSNLSGILSDDLNKKINNLISFLKDTEIGLDQFIVFAGD